MTAPLVGLGTIVVNTSVQFTTQALDLFFDKQIDVIFMNGSGKIKGHLFSQKKSGVIVRMAQYALFLDKGRRLDLAKRIVAGKIANQQLVIAGHRDTSG